MPAAYPFSAVVGLDDLRLALLLTAVNPAIGGVLVRGEKGTAKSTVVRALATLLPEIDAVRGCRFGCDPAGPDPDCPDGPHGAAAPVIRRRSSLVELPVGATEDRVVGTLDIQRALSEGVKAYEPGLLATAHRGLLYVDEVNLLPDHLVDLLLDAAAMGRAHVERDGVSVKHAARFLLVGTMNPEEGEPRPQLVDRFGLVVSVTSPDEAAPRAEVVRRRLAYDADPDGFAARWAADDEALAGRIAAARERLVSVALPDGELDRIARICLAYGVDGLRADIVVARAALTLAAWHGRGEVTAADVRDAARLALPHRRRRDPLDPPGTDQERLEETLSSEDPDPEPEPPDGGPAGGGAPSDEDGEAGEQPAAAPGQPYRPRVLTLPKTGERAHAGRRSLAYARRGRVVGARLPRGAGAPHLPATLRAAAARGSRAVAPGDLREAVHVGREANLVLFVVDASGSMAARQRMSTVKAAVLSLLRDAYQRRDRVGMITFRGAGADEVLPPTSSHEVGVQKLARLRTGGRTPLAAGLEAAARTLRAERRRDPRRRPLLVLVTDGRSTAGADPLTAVPALAGTASVVVDCEAGPVRLGLARRLAAALDAACVPLSQLSGERRRAA
ncbi:VWA domain-containing protein [Phytohabitans suffuscus]|uniref:Mg-protoporphyrin IX chelatase n=1 Tax=Phytohabitans suffuscus TaxID=624315 RepID=A0A6F8YS12_9ACTN|nr:VWA domain-containing protein [Phytohabitans suffuscus]BCB88940.1 magnesium chelatase [Phytohabitans suffuscus]